MINKPGFRNKFFIALFLTALLFAQPATASARDWNDHGRHGARHHENHYRPYRSFHHRDYHYPYYVRSSYPRYGKIVVRLPGGFASVVVGGRSYSYYEGVYYERRPTHYVVVPPPPVVIEQQQVLVSSPSVPEPNLSVSDQVTVQESKSQQAAIGETFTIHIPNQHIGGFTEVTLKKVEDGYIGPQGELYYDFPKVDQLVAIYAQ